MTNLIKKLKEISALCMQRQIWRRVVMTLSCIVVFVTTYMLILPAITLERDAAEAENGIEIDADTIYFPENDLSNNDGEEYREDGYAEADYTENAAASDIGEGYLKNDEAEDDKQNVKTVAGTQDFMTGIQTVIGSDYVISADVSENARIPADANLVVDELTGEMYESYYAQVLSNLGASDMPFARFFDIRFEINGDEIQPAADVNVTIELAEVLEDDVKAVHFEHEVDTLTSDPDDLRRAVDDEDLSNELDAEPEDDENRTETNKAALIDSERVVAEHLSSAVSFTTNSFSVYGIVGTVIEKSVLASDGKNYKIIVTYGAETEIPEGAELEVEEILPPVQDENSDPEVGQDDSDETIISSAYDDYVSKTENVLGMEKGSAGYIRLFDIKIVDQNDHSVKYQPAEGTAVDVRIELSDKDSSEEAAASTQVVHFNNEGMDGLVIENSTAGQIVVFEADGFSIYAIVDSSKRLQYNFYDGTSLLASEYIKKQDNTLQELYDPGVEPEYGQTFVGWAYSPDETNPSSIYTIEELNQQAAARYNDATEELTEINVYAIYDEAWYLRYMDQDAQGNAIVLNVVRVRKDATNKNVTIDYTFTPEEGIVFEGWIDVATGDTYQYGDTITLDHHVDLYVKLQGRNWLVFDSNAGGPGSGATYTPPQLLIGDEATTSKPDDPTRRGYTFTGWNTKADGTGTWWYKTDGSVNRFGNTLSTDTTLYAQWEANDTDYYVVFWKQRATDAAGLADDAKEYDYVSSEHRIAKTGETVSITTADQQKGGTANREYGYYFTYNGNNSDVTATVDANGTTVLNVYYDRREITYNFSSSKDFTVPSYTGVVDGQTVILTPDGTGGYTYQKEGETVNTYGWRYTDRYNRTYNLPSSYINGTFYSVRGTDGKPSTGTASAYTQNNLPPDSDTTQYYCYDTYDKRFYALEKYITGSTTSYTTEPYTGEVTTSTMQTRSVSYTGLYGSAFSNWPDPGNGRVWKISNSISLPLALTLFDPQAAVDPNATQTTVDFFTGSTNANHSLIIYVQDENGNWIYNDDYILSTATTSTGTWYPTETFEGFTLHSYQTGSTLNPNGIWTSITPDGSFNYNNNVYLRYSRNQHNIHFISQGPHVTGRTEHVVENVYYESDLNKFAHDGTAYYEPTNGMEGYYFAGWYADPDCQIPFDFNTTMPDSDITVYAKWDTYRVRVVLVPTPNNEHNDEVEFANNQALSFRLDYNEQVDDTNINTSVAKRPGYKLIGWYYSPDFDPATEIHFPVMINNNTPGVDMNYQSGEDWNKYGDNDGSHDNVRGILKLYAKWELDVDENSVYVEYDVDDVYRTYDTAGMLQTTIPVDDNKYALTNNNVTFQVAEAPTEYTSGFEFYRWVLLNPDGSESDIMYNPADTASEIPSSFIYEETITDDLGNTATIKKIRLKAKFNIETEKVTTVTFDGNGGVTNDSAQQESVTESYPINKDFLMKDENSFVREGYTLLGWAFEREDGSKITVETYKNAIATMTADELIQAGIYQLGQKVAADNLEVSDVNNWDPLENTVYAVWEINKYTVTVKKVVEGDSEGKTFTFTATASGDYTLPETDAGFALPHEGTKTIENVPYGTVLTFKETPASGYSIKNVDAKQTSLPDKTPLEESAYIELGGDDGEPLAIKGDTVITYTNEKAKEQKLRIHKIGDDAEDGLAGATFSLTSSDAEGFTNMTELVSLDGTTSVNPGYLPSGDASDTTLFTLPSGNYTLTETEAPQYYEGIAGDIALSVTGDGISITSYGADEEDPFDGVSISEPDVDGVYTLTVTNTKKKGTVTVVKNVIGNDADKDTEYRFTAKGLTQEDDAFVLHGRQLPENPAEGEAVTQENIKVYEDIPYGTVFSITEETYGDFETTIEISNEAEPITGTRTATGNVTVDGDLTITYTNKRNKQPVAIYKTGLGEFETITTGASFVVYKASEFNDDTQSANDEASVVAQGKTNENGILILGKLPIESGEEFTEYRLVETTAPAGYDLPDYLMKIFVYPDKVIGMQATGNMLIKDAEDYSDITDKSTTVLRVWNNPGVVLPSTGGPGTNPIYLLGTILTIFAGAGLVMRKRQRDAA